MLSVVLWRYIPGGVTFNGALLFSVYGIIMLLSTQNLTANAHLSYRAKLSRNYNIFQVRTPRGS